MQVITTYGPDQATKALLPFMAAKGALAEGDDVELFFMQEAAYLGSRQHVDLDEIRAPGLPSAATLLEELLDRDGFQGGVVCRPCARARHIDGSDLRDWAELGGAPTLARQAARHETTVTF